jgi:sortase A
MRGRGWGLLDTVSVLLGAVVIWGVLGASGDVLGWTLHQHHAGQALVKQARQELAELAASHPLAGCHELSPAPGQLLGILVIPSLHLTAPIEQGTSNGVLAVAVGHDSHSALPGQPGTAALLAHDVSYFVNIDELHPGAQINVVMPCQTVIFSVESHEVVRSGSVIPGSVQPTLVLDTCWPTDALWFTPTRYLVFAREAGVTQTSLGPPDQPAPGAKSAIAPEAHMYSNLVVPVPKALEDQGLTLVDNETPMGKMSVVGAP